MPKITAVIVAYNNAVMLRDMLIDLTRQSLPCHEIIVVDNSTNSAVEEMITGEHPHVVFLRMKANVGTAGGFHQGLKRAVRDCDFVLTLDDDVRMPGNAVVELHRGFVSLAVEHPRIGAVRAVGALHKGTEPFRFESFAWRGTMIRREAIKNVGLPCEDYFLYADDAEYSMRLAEQGYEFYYVPASRIMEMRSTDKQERRFFGRRIVCYSEDFRFYYAMRNSLHVWIKFRCPKEVLKTLLYGVKMSIFLCLINGTRSRRNVKAICRGVLDGARSELGRNPGYSPESAPPAGLDRQPRGAAHAA